MDLNGKTVHHTTYGEGYIISVSDSQIVVQFKGKETPLKMQYPNCFEHILSVDDESLKKELIEAINQAKAAKKAENINRQKEQDQKKEEAEQLRQQQVIKAKFGSGYHVEFLNLNDVMSYEDVEKKFGIKIAGFGRGINISKESNSIILISNLGSEKGRFTYHDKFTEDGYFIYSGEGQSGNQNMTGGNFAILNAKVDGKTIHVFVKKSPQEYYYQGVFELIEHSIKRMKDVNGKNRQELVFKLHKVMPSGSAPREE